MDVNEIYSEIVSFCRSNADEKIVKKYARYFKEGFDSYGLSTEKMDELKKMVLEKEGFDLRQVLEISKLLIKSVKYEETSLALMLVVHFSKKPDKDVFTEIESWFNVGINNWAHCDYLCGELLSAFILKDMISYKELSGWKTSANKFQRRAVPVSLIKVIKKRGGHREFFNFIDSLMMDEERVVHQGLGWFLREAWKLDKEQTEQFLTKWKDKSARLIFQYATEKMTKEERLRFRKEK